MYFVRRWFNLADEAWEKRSAGTVLGRAALVGIDLSRERLPDGTKLLKFRRLLEKHKLNERLFADLEDSVANRRYLADCAIRGSGKRHLAVPGRRSLL